MRRGTIPRAAALEAAATRALLPLLVRAQVQKGGLAGGRGLAGPAGSMRMRVHVRVRVCVCVCVCAWMGVKIEHDVLGEHVCVYVCKGGCQHGCVLREGIRWPVLLRTSVLAKKRAADLYKCTVKDLTEREGEECMCIMSI